MGKAAFGIKHKVTGMWFGGFGPAPAYEVLWVSQDKATTSDFLSAECQALLLATHDRAVQKKPCTCGPKAGCTEPCDRAA